MNYLKIIIHFTDNAPFQDGFKSYHHSLFYSVIRLINKNGWRKTKIDLGQILCMSGLSKPTYIEARKWLMDNKWIEVAEGKNAYQMAEFFLGAEVRIEDIVEDSIEDIVEDNIFTSTNTSTNTSTISSTLPIYNKLLSNKANKQNTDISIVGVDAVLPPKTEEAITLKAAKKLTQPKYSDDFEEFWKLYDKAEAGGKKQCYEKWVKLPVEEKSLIMMQVLDYKKRQPDPQYRKNPITYFNQKPWVDFVPKSELTIQPKKHERIDTRLLFGEPA